MPKPVPATKPALVQVRRDDLAWALKYMTIDGVYTAAVWKRLTDALQQFDGGGGDA